MKKTPDPKYLPRALARTLQPFQKFFRTESAGGLLLLAATAAAFVWANSGFSATYHQLFEAKLTLQAFGHGLAWPLHRWINDALMTVFFFVVGMEIKRELVTGELRGIRRAILPMLAAAGGMAVPALIFLAINGHGPGVAGWGIPVATDIAFALGCLALLKGRVPASLAVFLTALAIFDDLGAILVIAIFYGQTIAPAAVIVILALTLLLIGLNRRGVSRAWPYLLLGIALWVAVLLSGVHATIAGVILGLCIPRKTLGRLVPAFHPWVAFGIVPLFAMANGGVELRGATAAVIFAPVSLGIMLGLFLGKQVGIFLATLIAIKIHLSPMPSGANWKQLYGTAILGGIGFTMSLFIAALAFPGATLLSTEAKIGILAGSLVSAAVGLTFLRVLGQRQ